MYCLGLRGLQQNQQSTCTCYITKYVITIQYMHVILWPITHYYVHNQITNTTSPLWKVSSVIASRGTVQVGKVE